MNDMSTGTLEFLPLGGVGEIGMNLALYGYHHDGRKNWIVVDFGLSFPGDKHPGVEVIYPDIDFLIEHRDEIEAILITHAHEDHYGAIGALWGQIRKPLFMTPFAAGLLEAKGRAPEGLDVTIVQPGDVTDHGPFSVEWVAVTHSIPEPCSLAITTPVGLVMHTGDWKLDPDPVVGLVTDQSRFEQIGEAGVLALICDSTNAIREGRSPGESDVKADLQRFIDEATGRVAVTMFSSNVARIRTVIEAAAKAEREVVVVGRALRRAIEVARSVGYLDGLPLLLDEEAFGYMPRDKVLALCTGSQGEARAALAKIAANDHHQVTLNRGDRVIFSSRTIPGNEKSVSGIINDLIDQGIEVITDNDGLVHVSGHPRRDELSDMYRWIKPAIAVPVHGEAMHLAAHANLARDIGVDTVVEARNGTIVQLHPAPASIVGHVETGIWLQDGKLILPDGQSGTKERRKLAFVGVVTVAVVLNAHGEQLAPADFELIGLPEVAENGDSFDDIIGNAIDGTLASIPRKRRRDAVKVEEAIGRAVRAAVRDRWGKKPFCSVLVTRID